MNQNDIQKMRDGFERYMRDRRCIVSERYPDGHVYAGHYVMFDVEKAWELWQAAAAHQREKGGAQ